MKQLLWINKHDFSDIVLFNHKTDYHIGVTKVIEGNRYKLYRLVPVDDCLTVKQGIYNVEEADNLHAVTQDVYGNTN